MKAFPVVNSIKGHCIANFRGGKVEHPEWSNLCRADQRNDLHMLGGN
jgi:hypothetical protein